MNNKDNMNSKHQVCLANSKKWRNRRIQNVAIHRFDNFVGRRRRILHHGFLGDPRTQFIYPTGHDIRWTSHESGDQSSSAREYIGFYNSETKFEFCFAERQLVVFSTLVNVQLQFWSRQNVYISPVSMCRFSTAIEPIDCLLLNWDFFNRRKTFSFSKYVTNLEKLSVGCALFVLSRPFTQRKKCRRMGF